ncbi:MAG: sugar transferase [Anaerolineae bacterium]|jgi:sugar transferase EpsL
MSFYARFGKRALDLTLTILALPLLLWFIALVAFFVRLKMGPPVLYRDRRPGFWGEPFMLYKFRTMTEAASGLRESETDAERLTAFGRFLRSTSLDELPQLYNVLRGDMSLVGPRPLLMRYLPLYTPEQARRHEVKPGITGWAQVNGRNAISWEEKFALDVWYVDNQGLGLDLCILVRTLWKVLRQDAISQPGFATAEEFRGEARETAGEVR